MMKQRGCWLGLIAFMLIGLCLVGVLVYFLLQTPPEKPMVLINSPHNGERVGVGQEMIIHALARGDAAQKIKRIELWVDGKLQAAENSSIAGGVSPFPLVVNWRPPTPGAHIVTVRAYNNQNARGIASINLEAIASGDRDNDSVPDALDACPDQPGLASGNGCPAQASGDRDGDGVLDSADACADQPGSLRTDGCPDADGDRVRDSVDACPREFGVPERNGCPAPSDADGDGTVDSSDECPREPGPTSTRGCPDRDSDNVRDRDDACPDVAGLPGLAGCPDRDNDGVRDSQDLCPEVAGPASNSGCPVTGSGDRDGDGVRDDTDLSPDEPGPADSGGVPAPGGGTDGDGDAIPDSEEPPAGGLFEFPGLLGQAYTFTSVDFQALEFRVLNHDFDSVYCYAGLNDAIDRYGPFDPLGNRRWDIAEYLGGNNSRHLAFPQSQPLRVHVECYGQRRNPFGGGYMSHVFDLGSIDRQHPPSDWDGHILTYNANNSPEGYSFDVRYRICQGSCASPNYQSPVIHLERRHLPPPTRYTLRWSWNGDRTNIEGFAIIVNGSRVLRADRNASSADIGAYRPSCEQTRHVLVAVMLPGGQVSPPSNVIDWTGGTCPRTIRVTFETLDTHIGGPNPPGPKPRVGPIRGSLWVNDERIDYNTNHKLAPDNNYAVNTTLTSQNVFTIDLGDNEDLTIGGTVIDKDSIGSDDTLFSKQHTFRAGETLPERYVLSDRLMKLVVKIEVIDNP